MLISNNQISEVQVKAIENLHTLCLEMDGGSPMLYPHLFKQKRVFISNFFYFNVNSIVTADSSSSLHPELNKGSNFQHVPYKEPAKLMGFLSIYFFYEDACEISLLVSPETRRQGIAKKLLHAAKPLLDEQKVDKLIFSTGEGLNKNWLQTLGFCYKNSEHHMLCYTENSQSNQTSHLLIRDCNQLDLQNLVDIDKVSFTQNNCIPEDSSLRLRYNNLLHDENYTLLLAFYNNTPIGKATLRSASNTIILSDLAVLPKYRGQGAGSELLNYCILKAKHKKVATIELDLDAANSKALDLYLRNGFLISKTTDYWEISRKQLYED